VCVPFRDAADLELGPVGRAVRGKAATLDLETIPQSISLINIIVPHDDEVAVCVRCDRRVELVRRPGREAADLELRPVGRAVRGKGAALDLETIPQAISLINQIAPHDDEVAVCVRRDGRAGQ